MVKWRRGKARKRVGYTRDQTRQLGSPKAQHCKRNQQVYLLNNGYTRKTLYTHLLTNIGTGSSAHARTRTSIKIVGIKLRLFVINENGVAAGSPTGNILWMNMAIVSPKDSNTTPDEDDFFTRDEGTFRGQAFTDYANMSGLDYATKNINTAKFVVRWHHRFTLGASANAGTSEFGECVMLPYKKLSRWVPINRTFAYNDAQGNTCMDNMYLIHWATGPNDAHNNPPVGGGEGYRMTGRVMTFFHDVNDNV